MLCFLVRKIRRRTEQAEQRHPRVVPRVVNTSETGDNETDVSELRRREWSKRTYEMRKEDVMVHESGALDPTLAVMAKIFTWIEVLWPVGSYELVYQLPAQFILSVGQVNVDVTWSRDEVLVGIFTCSVVCTYPYSCLYFVACLVLYLEWDVPLEFVTWCQLGQVAWEQSEELWVFLRTWDNDVFCTVCVATLDQHSDDLQV